MSSNPGPSDVKPATNSLSYCTAHRYISLDSYLTFHYNQLVIPNFQWQLFEDLDSSVVFSMRSLRAGGRLINDELLEMEAEVVAFVLLLDVQDRVNQSRCGKLNQAKFSHITQMRRFLIGK
jgi:hypothetical protein